MTQRGAIVLCGGRSTRMGLPKLSLPFGPELMLLRVIRLVGAVVDAVVVVAAPGQEVPPLPEGVPLVRDRREQRGPLEGLSAGLSALPADVESAFATGCDVPLLVPALVRRMFELLGEHDVAVPKTGGYHHPLATVYRRSVLAPVESLLAEDRLRPFFLFEKVRTREVSADELTDVDPELASLENLNRPEDYLSALARAGFTPTEKVLRSLAGTR
jgi:molybdopterin-guanine dinucleotide biosynthesis protein A